MEIQRRHSIEDYYSSPNECLNCRKVIHIGPEDKASEVKKRRFCGRRCHGLLNGHKGGRKRVVRPVCSECEETVDLLGRKRCRRCRSKRQSKLGSLRKCDVDRRTLYNHSRFVMNDVEKKCNVCGYKLIAEVCHIRPVRGFPEDSLLSEINNPSNLIYLCPNHHWEFDHNLLELSPP